MKQHNQGFASGINQDISTNKYPSNNIYWAQNFRLVSKDGLATGALTNIAGNSKVLSLAGPTEKVQELCLIRDTLVIFVASDSGGRIYIWEHTDTDFETESPKLIYSHPDLMFDSNNPVRAVGRYENENVQKIYFTDGNTFFKHLNIVHPTLGLGADLTSLYALESLDLVSNITFSPISLEIVSGGNLKAGKIQYAYQLYSKRGSESIFSPASDLIHITNSDETKTSKYYLGDEVGTVVNKSINITIPSIDTLFTRLRVVALEYTVLYQQPSIRIVGEYDVENLTSITVTDTGNSIGELTSEEFGFLQNDFYPKSLDIKNDYLFAANIKNEYFEITDEEFDARAFRANSTDVIKVFNRNSEVPIPYPFVAETMPAQTDEQFNSFNDIANDWANNNKSVNSTLRDAQYKFKPGSGGTILGGAGVNISYEFTIDQVILDDTPKSNSYGTSGGTYPKCTVGTLVLNNSNSSPYANVGYQRDEIYRFGIVFFDKKGRQSFVKWVGDIRFPANYDQDANNSNYNYVEYDSVNNRTLANILGIKFTVNIPSEVQAKISGYQIVRAERTNSDKTIVAQGLVGYPTYCTNVNSTFLYSQATPCLMDNMVAKTSRVQRNIPAYKTIGYPDQSLSDHITIKYDSRWIEFDSPDIAINKPILPTTNAFVELFGVQNEVETSAISGVRGYEGLSGPYQSENDDLDKRDILTCDKTRNVEANSTVVKSRAFVNNSRILQPKTRGNDSSEPEFDATKSVLEDGQKHNNQCYYYSKDNGSANDKAGLRGTYALLTTTNELPLDSSWLLEGSDDIRFGVANYRVSRGRAIYGGSTSEARSTTKYYPASKFLLPTQATNEIFGGDTYISYFTYLRSIYDHERGGGSRIETYVFYPVESTINLHLRLDDMQNYINWGLFRDSNVTDYRLMESVNMGVSIYGSNYPSDVGNLYRYNSAYSCINKSKEFYSQPFDFTQTLDNDTRIVASEKKINGEYIDSWTKFKFNNYIDVDSKHNAITKILAFKDNLYFIQPTAVGIASVNQRSLIQDNQPGQLALGTGGILTRYDYITDKSGSEFYDGIIATDDFIFYVDGRRKRANKLVPGKEEAISVIKGIDSTLDKLPFETVSVGFDRGYNEVLFSIDGVTLSFSEMSGGFTSSYTFSPGKMISIGGSFYTTAPFDDESPWLYADTEFDTVGYSADSEVDPTWDYIIIGPTGVGEGLYKHNVGNPGEFYGSGTAEDSYVTLIINPEGNQICAFDLLDLRTESTNNGVDQPDDIFYRMEASNNYQEITRELSFTSGTQNVGTVKRIGRVWRTPIMPIVASGVTTNRMMDTYLKVTLRYDNSFGNKFRLHDVGCVYRPANH